MIKRIVALFLLAVILAGASPAQTRKKPRSKKPASKKAAPEEKPAPPPVIGSSVAVVTKNGDQVTGTLVELTAYSVRIKADNLESIINLDTISTIGFGGAAANKDQTPQRARPGADFTRYVETVLAAFQSLAAEIRGNTGYTEYGRQLTDLKRVADRFVVKFGSSEDPTESRSAAIVAAALTDYTWARTIWTLKFGYSGTTTVFETDSPAVGDTLSQYPDLRQAAASENKFSADKLINGLWKKAADKVEILRALGNRSR